ncbi:hypothetical protein FJU31_03105 [Stenotrophomonas cyclobalanopsidis]|uniref:DUF3077 domain-containing protein n=1 Tax=Stenotrophomonas cyclobalanopsidis TaxID=2771362 RepID=A0ABQ6T5K4_9GAMM|nr:hypothetical protein [Stenotrophomonas cyclobalanopsidis]KAA9003858.1 hypothetical protein FJU31_03105 [Stenotrophomonas cyclobalanopsidis]
MSASKYPFLFATLGEAATRLPEDLARTLESTLAATQAANTVQRTPDGITVLNCLQRIRQGEAADGQPWPDKGHTPGQRMALASIDRANAGQTFLLELLHAIERTRVDGDEDAQAGDAAREGLLFACRALAAYVGEQVQAA